MRDLIPNRAIVNHATIVNCRLSVNQQFSEESEIVNPSIRKSAICNRQSSIDAWRFVSCPSFQRTLDPAWRRVVRRAGVMSRGPVSPPMSGTPQRAQETPVGRSGIPIANQGSQSSIRDSNRQSAIANREIVNLQSVAQFAILNPQIVNLQSSVVNRRRVVQLLPCLGKLLCRLDARCVARRK